MRWNSAFTVALAAGLVMSASAGLAQSGDAEQGLALSRQLCAECHLIAAGKATPRQEKVPDFHAIADMPGVGERSLHVFLSTTHGKMPNLVLTQPEQDDVIAYILSLRGRK
jgi:mono/diheme cytochrome c family protein